MRRRISQLIFRRNLGGIETGAEAKRRLNEIKKVKNEIEESGRRGKDSSMLEFRVYRNEARKRMVLLKKVQEEMQGVNQEIGRINKKIENEYMAVERVNRIIRYEDEDETVVENRESRAVEGREKELREELEKVRERRVELEALVDELTSEK
ncbi:hypothetical protein ECANGB1_2070 [Enterospora canceri]|uniref:Uncharacterized protein n=1 Tax=Enterospora canceri TaxID=1081671 RepID=A0A1Y1S8T6_9MICR|nr:hypothetical protein ECANGB1_2070 [Enterospora canceri]